MIRKLLMISSVFMLLAAVYTGGQSAWISGKAVLAQWLLNQAWQRSVATKQSEKAWPWADAAPVARMSIPSLGRSFIILSNASGEALAFGPGLVAGNPKVMSDQTLAIGGHRDTHLAVLQTIKPGTRVWLQNTLGQSQQYRLKTQQIIDSRTQTIALNQSKPGLVLITCFPFNASAVGGPLRLVITADAVPFMATPSVDKPVASTNTPAIQISAFNP